ncbi:MAG: PEP-CTERM sorting domain-containing protein [bacterium]|nr:PEP-CTERM sorting domain-containing protein [bacterium]
MTARCFLMMILAVMIGCSLGTREVRAYTFLDRGEHLDTLTPCPSEPGLPNGVRAGVSGTHNPGQPVDGQYEILTLLAFHGPFGSDPDGETPSPPPILRLSLNSGLDQASTPTALPDHMGLAVPEAGGSDQRGPEEEESPIPEPATMVLLGISMVGLASYGRFRMKD